MNFKEEIFKSIQGMVDRAVANCKVDRTYRTVIKRTEKNGYVITDETDSERTIPCGIPNIELRVGQSAYVKEPLGKLNELHICNIAGNASKSGSRRR